MYVFGAKMGQKSLSKPLKNTPFAYLMTSDDRVHYDDNYVTLYPNEPKTLRVENCTETPVLHVAAPAPSEETKKASYTDSWF